MYNIVRKAVTVTHEGNDMTVTVDARKIVVGGYIDDDESPGDLVIRAYGLCPCCETGEFTFRITGMAPGESVGLIQELADN